jgi:uncharacterized protein
MRLHSLIPALIIQSVWIAVPLAIGQTNRSLEKFRAYEQGRPISVLIETRAAIFAGTGDDAVRAAREQELAGFIASDAHPQAKAIAIDWLGCLGSAAAVPPLAAALQDPALAAPAAAALERIPGPEAAGARAVRPAGPARVSPVAAEAAEFTQALENGNDDQRIEAALRSPNELLAGTALRLLRAGAGTPALLQRLAVSLDQVPAARQAALCDALASRPDAVASLRPALIARVRSGPAGSRPAALATLGRILRPDDLPMVLERASDSANPALAAAARAALARATDPAIDDALARHAATGGPGTLAAIDALAARHAVQAVDALWNLTASPDAGIAAAAFKSLGILIPPADLPALVEKLAAAQGNPAAGETGKLVWNVVRRHPEPAAAADLLEKLAASAPADMQQLLRRYAARLRPQDAPPQSRLNLPAGDDSPRLAPDFHEQLVHLNCGSFAEARGGGIQIRRTAGRPYQFGDVAHPLATVDFGKELAYEISGLDPAADYVLGFSAWDADHNGRRQSLSVNNRELLPDFAPVAYHSNQPTYIRAHLPLARDLTAAGTATLTMKSLAGPNAVLSDIRLLRRKADAPLAKRVLILTGDDHPAHLWRLTGPEFAAILRADPRLEVTISESPALLGSPALSSYQAVFLHFKNYNQRLPTGKTLWDNLEHYVRGGGGLVIAHFGCGAMEEWQGFVKVAGRVWDPGKRAHDPYGEFLVRILQTGHPATNGLAGFTTTDELYTCLAGDTEIQVLAEATSKVDQKAYPMAFVLSPGQGRVFHSPLGHDVRALEAPGARQLYLQGTIWATGTNPQ